MCVARCLLSWLLFAATTDFCVYFWVERLVTIIVDNLYDVIAVHLYICMYNIFSGVIPGWSMMMNKKEELTDVFRVHFSHYIPTLTFHCDVFGFGRFRTLAVRIFYDIIG